MSAQKTLKQQAYQAVAAGGRWLLPYADNCSDFADDYTRIFQPDAPLTTPMPIAECLMALLTLREESYEPLGLPRATDEQIARVTVGTGDASALHLLGSARLGSGLHL